MSVDVAASRCTETKAPGIGGLQGRKRGCPSSRGPVNRLQMGFVPKSGRLLPTRTTMVPGRPSPAIMKIMEQFSFAELMRLTKKRRRNPLSQR